MNIFKRPFQAIAIVSLWVLLGSASWASPSGETISVSEKLESLTQSYLDLYPETAVYMGEAEKRTLWSDTSEQGIEYQKEQLGKLIASCRQLQNGNNLTEEESLNLQLFEDFLVDEMCLLEANLHLIPWTPMQGQHLLQSQARDFPLETQKDYEDWSLLLQGLSQKLDQDYASFRKGGQVGRMLPKSVVPAVLKQLEAHLVEDPKQSPLYQAVPQEAGEEYLTRLASLIESEITPRYRAIDHYLRNHYPAPEADGLGAQAKGKEAYSALISHHTGTDLTPKEIHEIGLQEVARIKAEMEAIKSELGYEGSLREFFQELRKKAELHFTSREEMMMAYRAFGKKVDYLLPTIFEVFPSMPYGIEPMNQAVEENAPTAYYIPLAGDRSRAGKFVVNTYQPETRPRYDIPALTLHEAVPGHHFQIAYAAERDDLPRFRRFGLLKGATAYIEGWGLYAETLGKDLGLYDDIYDRLGFLGYDMWRACRLVVDTGLHTQGWSKQQAIDFMLEHMPKSRLDITVEVERYMVMPAQALSYKLGCLTILELRKQAKETLGKSFSVKRFHTQILKNSALPLSILRSEFEAWLEKEHALEGHNAQ